MTLKKSKEEQEPNSDKAYDVINGLNIYFEGLLTLDITDKYKINIQTLNEYLSKANEYIECEKINTIGTVWQIRCKNDSKQNAIDSMKNYLSIVLKQENIELLNIGISISLSHFNHKDIDSPLTDSIDYSLFEHFSAETFSILPKLLEPTESCFAKWNGKRWSERS